LNHRHESWLSLIIIDYHWLSMIIIDYPDSNQAVANWKSQEVEEFQTLVTPAFFFSTSPGSLPLRLACALAIAGPGK
jgi:hypothetical protein